MRKLIKRFIRWALSYNDREVMAPALAEVSQSQTVPSLRIGVMKAMNGRLLELSTYKPNPHGPDWTTELFIVPEDQTLGQALTMVLTLKGINE